MNQIKILSVVLMLGCASSIAHADVRSHGALSSDYFNGSSNDRKLVPMELIPNVKKLPQAPLKFAQNSEGIRILQLEDQMRFLNGQVEEMQFQLLQMQEQMRKMQEDNEFRFQELEQSNLDGNKKSGETRLGKPQPSDSLNGKEPDGKELNIIDLIEGSIGEEGSALQKHDMKSGARSERTRTIDGVVIFDPNKDKSADELGADANIKFGEFKFDGGGNVITNSGQNANGGPIRLGKPLQLDGIGNSANNFPAAPSDLFELGYQYVQAGQYGQSALVFEEFANLHPLDKRLAAAQFWLGESYFSVGRYEDAAQIFLLNHKEHPNAKLAAQNLLKLGASMAGLNQREIACATYAEVPKKYPEISQSVKKRILVEQQSINCKN